MNSKNWKMLQKFVRIDTKHVCIAASWRSYENYVDLEFQVQDTYM